jgi:hypothetical protein
MWLLNSCINFLLRISMERFAKICYLYSRQDLQETRLLFHAQWFIHSSRTILQEAEDPNELCVIHECEHDLDLNSIIQKVKVRGLAPLDFTPDNLDHGELYYAWVIDLISSQTSSPRSLPIGLCGMRLIPLLLQSQLQMRLKTYSYTVCQLNLAMSVPCDLGQHNSGWFCQYLPHHLDSLSMD